MNRDSAQEKDDFRDIWSCLATIRGSAQLAKRAANAERATPQQISGYLTSVIEHVDLLSLRLAVMESRERRDQNEDRMVHESGSYGPRSPHRDKTPNEERHQSGADRR